MGLFGFGQTSSPLTADFKEFVARYKRIRPMRLRLNNELVSRLSRDALTEGAKKLGMYRAGTFVFENEDQTSVLMDYCLYDVYCKGRNAVEQYLCDCPPDVDSDEMTLLRAMQHATYTMIAVLSVEPGVGCHVRNLFTEETRLLVDNGFSQTAQSGMLMATRLLDFGGFVITSGAALPLGILDDDELDAWQRKIRTGVHVDAYDPAPLIRGCLENGASSHVQYEGADTPGQSDVAAGFLPVETPARRSRAPSRRQARKTGPNRR